MTTPAGGRGKARGGGGLPDNFDPVEDRRRDRERATGALFNQASAPAVTEVTDSDGAAERPTVAEPATPEMSVDQENKEKPKVTVATVHEISAATGAAPLPMPAPRRRRVPRVQLNTRVRSEVEGLLQKFISDQDAAVQDVVDMALTEWLAARGYQLPKPKTSR